MEYMRKIIRTEQNPMYKDWVTTRECGHKTILATKQKETFCGQCYMGKPYKCLVRWVGDNAELDLAPPMMAYLDKDNKWRCWENDIVFEPQPNLIDYMDNK